MLRRIWSLLVPLSLGMLLNGGLSGSASAQAIPGYVFSDPLLPLVLQMPENGWLQVNTNLFSDVWTSPDLEPLDNGATHPPSKLILAWSGFAWDSNRGDLILYGGGHANYSGNDVYRWHAGTLRWERASLPSEIFYDPVSGFQAIDGVDAAPSSAHTYKNNLFLPIADRFMTWGGAAYDNGGPYLRELESDPTQTRPVGPYLFDPNRADGNKVGGTTGSHVERVAPHPEIVGGLMWQNRDIHKNLAGSAMPGSHVNGCTSYAAEGGHDVVYVAASNLLSTNLDVYRYQLTDIANPASDQISQVGAFWVGTAGQTTCGYDPSRKLFVRTGTNAIPFVFWDLTTPGPGNPDQRVNVDSTIAGFQAWMTSQGVTLSNCALEFDPVRHTYPVWCGAAAVWELHPPVSGNTVSGWTIAQLPQAPTAAPTMATVGTGILGKWRYVPYFDAYVGLENVNEGHVWIYKPKNWTQPNPPGNALPSVTITSPADGAAVAPGAPVEITATASDADGTISRVEYYADGVKLGTATSAPYTLSWTPILVDTYAIVAIAVDNLGGMRMSPVVNLDVTATITTATLQRGVAGYAGASDTYLNATATATAFGASNPLVVDGGNYTPLLRFAIFQSEGGPVPDGAVIQSATLQLYKQFYDNALQLNALQKPWVESQATWQIAQTGTGWTVPGAAGQGSDYVVAPDASTAGNFNPGWISFDVTARIIAWANATGANYGWRMAMVVPNSVNGIQFNSSEYTTDPTLRPKLTIVYAPPNGQPPPNNPPTVTLTGPANGTSTTLGGSFALAATAGDSDGTVTKVEFLANGSVVGQSTSAPYGMTWTPAATGSYTLAARATDNLGAPTTSNTVTVNVTPANIAPTVTLTSPANGASTTLGGSFALAATAGDTDGTVTKVEFLANGSVVGQSTLAPYAMTWVPAAVGSYTLAARATDNLGAMTTSGTVMVTVTATSTTSVVMQRGLLGYAGVSDTYLDGYLHTTVRGTANPLPLNVNYTPLLRFAIFQSEGGPVPNGVTIQSAKLELYKQYYDGTVQLHALQKAWVESQATWNNSQTGIAWSVGGAAGAGTDYATATDAQLAVGFNPGWVSFDATSRVQQWSSGVATNNGWRLMQVPAGSVNAIQFNSSEFATDPTLRPKLTVVYGSGGQPPNNLPTVTLTGPADGASTTLGGSFALSATAGDSDGTVTKVEFLANGSVVGQSTSAPYGITWVPAATGSYTLAARATDNLGAATTSGTVVVSVTPGNIAPTVTLTSPSNAASTALGGSFALAATAGDTDGTVTKVEFLANGSVVGQSTLAPYAMTWVPAAVGSYTLAARATDNLGAMTTSGTVMVTVTATSTTSVVMQRGLLGYAGVSDTYLDGYLHTTVRGTANPLPLNVNYTPLLRFAIFQSEGGPVPNGVTIQSAKLELYKQYYDGTVQLHALQKAWVESQATWNNSQTGIAWSVGGAAGAGTDYATATDAQLAVGFNPGWVSFDATSRVQQWSSGAATNNGWRLMQVPAGSVNAIQFNSSEFATDPTLRPRLTVVY